MSRFPTETIIAPASTLKDYSGHTVAGAGKEIMPADASARLYRIQNLSKTETLWFNDTGAEAAADTPGSYALAPGGITNFHQRMRCRCMPPPRLRSVRRGTDNADVCSTHGFPGNRAGRDA